MPKTYDVIASTTLSSNQSSVTFSSLGSYTDLVIIGTWRFASTGNDLGIRFNGDTTNGNYPVQQIVAESGNAVANNSNGTNLRAVNNGVTNFDYSFELNIIDYRNTSQYKPVITRFSGNNTVGLFAGCWLSNSAITQIDLVKSDGTGTIASGSVFTLIGVLKA
jgi:hypothetical protein